jgi:hypothetical protein
MSAHLSTQELVDALEGTLPDARQAHLTACEACSREIAELTGVARETQLSGEVPEPSPLFWDHFSARVRTATEAEAIRPLSWWERAWQPIVAVSAVAATVLLAVLVFKGRSPETVPIAPASTTAAAGQTAVEPIDDSSFDFVVRVASGSTKDELHAARPSADTTAAMLEDLTPEQQAEFIRLLKTDSINNEQ